MENNRRKLWPLLVILALFSNVATMASARGNEHPKHATLEVDGLGWWQDRQQRIALDRMLGQERGATLDANAVEDAAFLLLSALQDQGYLKPVIETELTSPSGERRTIRFDARLEATLERPFEAARVSFRIKKGVRYEFAKVEVHGLKALKADSAREYFLGEKALIRRGSTRAYSPAHLRRALEGIENDLHRLGFADATATADQVRINDKSGEVDLVVDVHEGPRWQVRTLTIEGAPQSEPQPTVQPFVGQPWSQFWQQDVTAAIREHFLRRGYPDIRVWLTHTTADERQDGREVAVVAHVRTGELVRIGEVRFEGEKKTAISVLRRRVKSEAGQPLNVVALDQARFRLSRLGIFDTVDLRYDPSTGPVRNPVFVLREGRELETNLLFGYGSYEQLRGGVELRQYNLFGRAHQTRLLLVQSMKSSRGEYSYTVPELFGESIDGTARVFGLQRQETSFLRQEWGGNVSLSAPVRWIGANASVGYTYQALRSLDNTLETHTADEQQVTAASVDVNLVRDRRDNPLRPHQGYRWFLQAETASHYFGGSVDYQRVELGGSYHTPWGRGRWVHLGFNHGLITTFGGSSDADLPVNKRFFPGGDNSIRGYRVGEAAPRGPTGEFVGAKSYMLANVEVEQALTGKWSLVGFCDALGTAVRLADYPFSERLYSAGLGVRYQTLIGPLRAEYGRNLNPRTGDPAGTLLFSVGFPF